MLVVVADRLCGCAGGFGGGELFALPFWLRVWRKKGRTGVVGTAELVGNGGKWEKRMKRPERKRGKEEK